MKQFTLLVLILIFGFNMQAQKADREEIIVEGATGFWTTFCAGATIGADELLENDYNVAIILNHYQDSLANSYSIARNSYYGITVYPTFYFDGILSVVGGNSTTSMFPEFEPKVFERQFVPSDFDLNMDFEKVGDTYNVTINVENVGGNISDSLFLFFVVTESKLPLSWGLAEEQNHVNRLMLPNDEGTPLDFSSGSLQEVTLNFIPEPFWDTDYCELIAFVQDTGTREILQGTKEMLAFPEYPIDAQAKKIKFPNAEFCGESIEPVVFIKNMGENNLTSVDIIYTVNDENFETYSWTGDLEFNVGENVSLPVIDFTQLPMNNFSYELSNPNGQTDPNPENDTLSFNFAKAPQAMFDTIFIHLKTDDYSEENTWNITDSEGNILYASGELLNMPDTLLIDTVLLCRPGCYTFNIFDSFGDGLCCVYGDGYYKVLDQDSVLLFSGAEFRWEEHRPFERVGENTLLPDFSVEDTLNKQWQEVAFTDLTCGLVDAWQWEFEGATPETSIEQNPVVFYSDTGVFDVKLKVTYQNQVDSILKPDYIYIDLGVGIEAQKKNKVDVFPNPTNGMIYVTGDNIKHVDIFSITGSQVISMDYIENEKIDISKLGRGIYFLKIQLDDDSILSRKISLLR